MSQEMRLLSHRSEVLRTLKDNKARIEQLQRVLTGPGNRPAAGLRREVTRVYNFLDTAIERVMAVPITQVEKLDAKKAKEARRS